MDAIQLNWFKIKSHKQHCISAIRRSYTLDGQCVTALRTARLHEGIEYNGFSSEPWGICHPSANFEETGQEDALRNGEDDTVPAGADVVCRWSPPATAGGNCLISETVSTMIELVSRGRMQALPGYFYDTYSALTAMMRWVDRKEDKGEPPSRLVLFFFVDQTPELAVDSC